MSSRIVLHFLNQNGTTTRDVHSVGGNSTYKVFNRLPGRDDPNPDFIVYTDEHRGQFIAETCSRTPEKYSSIGGIRQP